MRTSCSITSAVISCASRNGASILPCCAATTCRSICNSIRRRWKRPPRWHARMTTRCSSSIMRACSWIAVASAGYRAWRDGMRVLAGCRNVAVKISGLAMFDHRWTVESLRPYVLETIDAFGVERAMFASNFPVDRLFGSYTDLWHAYASIVDGASAAKKRRCFAAMRSVTTGSDRINVQSAITSRE